MRSIAIGLAAALFAAALSPVAAFAADKKADAAKAAADAKSHETGMKEAPALAQQAGLPCTITDATYMGSGKMKGADGKEQTVKLYELVCSEGLGYLIQAKDGEAPQGFDCLAMSRNKPKPGEPDKGAVYCKLPANEDPIKSMQAVAAKAGVKACTVDKANWLGNSPTDKVDQYEISCAEGSAYVIQYPRVGSTRELVAADCFTMEPGKCEYFPKDKYLATLSRMAAPAGRTACQVTDGRYIGTSKESKNSFYEVACADQKSGFMLEADATGKYVRSIDCARASSVGGGCTLTAGAAAQTEENATYTRLAKSIGLECDVKSYHSFGQDQQSGREVVELACNNQPEGLIALLPVDKGQNGEWFNCVRASIRGLKCSLTPIEATYAKVSTQITGVGKACQVTNARGVGKSADGSEFVEVQCAAGGGQMLEYAAKGDQLKSSTSCGQAAGIGGGCKLGK